MRRMHAATIRDKTALLTRILRERERLMLTSMDLGTLLGVKPGTIRRWERGTAPKATFEKLIEWVNVLEKTPTPTKPIQGAPVPLGQIVLEPSKVKPVVTFDGTPAPKMLTSRRINPVTVSVELDLASLNDDTLTKLQASVTNELLTRMRKG